MLENFSKDMGLIFYTIFNTRPGEIMVDSLIPIEIMLKMVYVTQACHCEVQSDDFESISTQLALNSVGEDILRSRQMTLSLSQ